MPGLLSLAVLAASLSAGWLLVHDPTLSLAVVPLGLVFGGYVLVTGGRRLYPRGATGLRTLAGVATIAVGIIGMAVGRDYAIASGTSLYVMAAMLFVCALRGVWNPRWEVSAKTREELLSQLTLTLMIAIGVLLGGSWVEHTYSTVTAIPLMVAAWLIVLGVAIRIAKRQRAEARTRVAHITAVVEP